jgi:hypothetical protein
MPLSLHRSDNGAQVPIATLPLTLGSDRVDDIVVTDVGVRSAHARLRLVKGDLLLTAGDGLHVHVNGEKVAFMVVRAGDRMSLGDPARGRTTEFALRDRMAGAFVPPGVDRIHAWLRAPEASEPRHGPEAFGASVAIVEGSATQAVTLADGRRALLKTRRALDPQGVGPEHFLRLLQRLAGAPHPRVAPVLDGGVALRHERALPWFLTGYVEGRPLTADARSGGVAPAVVVAWLVDAGRGLAHLHRRGVLHRDVAPGNLVRTARGRVCLIDLGQAILADEPVPDSRGVIGTPGYVAPEEVLHGAAAVSPAVDVYGLAAVGYALLTGAAPAQGADVLDTLSRAAAPPPALSAMGVEVPAPLEAALQEALHVDPAQRPSMEAFVHALDFARVAVGL